MSSFFRNLFKSKEKPAAEPRLVLPVPQKAGAAPASRASSKAAAAPVPPPEPAAKREWSEQAARRIDVRAPAEELCGIVPGMTAEQIHEQLAALYRRHNRAATSLDVTLREEAELMLEAIAEMRQKYPG